MNTLMELEKLPVQMDQDVVERLCDFTCTHTVS